MQSVSLLLNFNMEYFLFDVMKWIWLLVLPCLSLFNELWKEKIIWAINLSLWVDPLSLLISSPYPQPLPKIYPLNHNAHDNIVASIKETLPMSMIVECCGAKYLQKDYFLDHNILPLLPLTYLTHNFCIERN